MPIPPPVAPPSGPGNATGNVAPWNLSANNIIVDAYLDAKVTGAGDEPDSEQTAVANRRLNKLVNYLQTKGIKLWLQTDLPIPIVAGQASYSLSGILAAGGLYPKRVLQGYFSYNNVALNRYPLIALSWNEYLTLGQVGNQGTINSYFVDKQVSDTVVTFWLTPDANAVSLGQPHLLVQNQVFNFANVGNLSVFPNFPPEWALALEWGLAAQLCSGQPAAVIERCERLAAFYQQELEDWDVEDASTFFQPDQRAMQASRFK